MMKYIRILTSSIILVLLLFSFFTDDSHAYLDPGTGSYIFQLIIAALFGVLLSIRIFWKNIKASFIKLSSKESSENEADEDD